MTRFWLSTFTVPPAPAADAPPPSSPILAAGVRNLAIEVLAEPGQPGYAILFSKVDDPKQPKALTCLIGFTNAAKACNVWRDRGIPLIDATIVSDDAGTLRVFSPFFGPEPAMQYEAPLFTLAGVRFEPYGEEDTLETRYQQALEAPDGAQPEAYVVRRAVEWKLPRAETRRLKPLDIDVDVTATRYPSLAPLMRGPLTPVSAWSGTAYVPDDQRGRNRGAALDRVSRADTFGVPAFRFEDVEVLGFRIDLGTYGRDFTRDLDRLIAPLNFHLAGPSGTDAIWDFRYRAATRVLLVELLRYGRMKLRSPSPPMAVEDFQSQHELLVRLLVGRVDDDTAQAHSPALYVPAIFVDNPWSKVLGRDLQGFDKRMATFWAREAGGLAPLRPDGRVAGQSGAGEPTPLGDIARVTLVDSTGAPVDPDRPRTILDLDCSPANYEDWDAFDRIDLGLALNSLSLTGTRWRQSDFDAVEFRRSFARAAVTESLKGFRSIQVSPVTDRGLEQAWITGTFVVDDDFQIARPSGIARLTFHAVGNDRKAPTAPSAGPYWNLLCEMLGDGRRADVSLPTGSWYRLLCSMDLSIDDGLDWAGAPS
jgi:hypothetical protein